VSGGRFFLDEIREQPAAQRALLAAKEELEATRRRIAERRRLVRLVAHGSSDNAAAFGPASSSRCSTSSPTLPRTSFRG
jgi:fructoselysine-6-P-deglycase FrlB-like protein